MNRRSRLVSLAVVTIVFSYMLTIGATFNGILNPEFHGLTLSIVGALVLVWLGVRWRMAWHWHSTPLDVVILLWVVTFCVSLVANWDVARRIAIGLWYVSVYIGVWYIVQDALQNRFLTRETVVDGLIIVGVVIVAFGYLQLQGWVRQLTLGGMGISSPPRPVSIFGNPNFLSDFLIVLIPLLLTRCFITRSRVSRVVLGLYLFLAFGLLFLTNSRGAWLGIAVALMVWAGLFLYHYDLMSPSRLVVYWGRLSTRIKRGIILGGLCITLIIFLVVIVFIRSFSEGGRSTDLRTEIYSAAVEMFSEKPLTGYGLFTFGRGLVSLPDIHPDKPHSHAHNVPLQVAAELGVMGLVALVAMSTVIVYWMRKNWCSTSGRERIMLIGAITSVAAFAVHQLTDVPAMMPAIALTGLLAVVLATTPTHPVSTVSPLRRLGHPAALGVAWGALLVTGFWSSNVYSKYVSILDSAKRTSDYYQAAQQLENVISADPNLSLYTMQQGFLYGMAASSGDLVAARAGVMAYQKSIVIDPGYAVTWANLAALHWQLGERNIARDAMQRALELDSVNWQYMVNLARYAEAMNDTDTANKYYTKALTLNPDASLYSELRPLVDSNLVFVDRAKMSVSAQTVMLLGEGEQLAAAEFWEVNPQPITVSNFVIQSLLTGQDVEAATSWLSKAENLMVGSLDVAWIHVGRARLARTLGNVTLVDEEVKLARESLVRDPLGADDPNLINIAYAQFLRFAIPRQYLPQVYYPVDDPVLIYLIETT